MVVTVVCWITRVVVPENCALCAQPSTQRARFVEFGNLLPSSKKLAVSIKINDNDMLITTWNVWSEIGNNVVMAKIEPGMLKTTLGE